MKKRPPIIRRTEAEIEHLTRLVARALSSYGRRDESSREAGEKTIALTLQGVLMGLAWLTDPKSKPAKAIEELIHICDQLDADLAVSMSGRRASHREDPV
jgi:hypothetical protein